jgi:hypothetical protein
MNYQSFAKTCADVKQQLSDAFTRHVLTAEGDGRWLCRAPDTNAYWFRLIVAPNALIVLGDLGEMVARPYTPDPIAWLRGAVGSPGYFVEKVQASKSPTKEFYPVECLQWLQHTIKEIGRPGNEGYVAALRDAGDAYRGDGLWQDEWLRIAAANDLDDAYDVGMFLSKDMLWMIEVGKCFIRLHDAEKATVAA